MIFPLRVSGRPSPTIWKNWRQTNLGFTLKMRSAIIRVESSRASRGFFQANISKTMKCRERFMSEVRYLALVTCAVSAALAVQAWGEDGPAAGSGDEIIVKANKHSKNLQDVGLSVSAISGDEIRRASCRDRVCQYV